MKSVAQTVIEADRFYTIAAHTGNVIQAVEGSKDGGTVRLGKYDHKPEQEWSFVREGDGVYRIRNRASGKLLDLTMTGTAQMWKVEHTPEGTVRLRSSWAGGKCVDTVGIGAEAGAVLQIWQEVPGGGDQLWVISEVKDRVKRAAKVEQAAAPAAETAAAPAKEAAPAKKPAASKPRTTKKVEEKPAAKTAAPVKAEKPAAKKVAKAKAEPATPAAEVKAASAVETETAAKAEPAAKAAPAAETKTAPAAAKPKPKRAPCKKTVKK